MPMLLFLSLCEWLFPPPLPPTNVKAFSFLFSFSRQLVPLEKEACLF